MYLRILPFVVITFLFTACSTSKEQKPEAGKVPDNQVETGESVAGFISGTITEIQPGKDGYTAKINTAAGVEYFVTISRANLSDPASYRTVNVGENIRVKGEQWEMENQKHITVRELK